MTGPFRRKNRNSIVSGIFGGVMFLVTIGLTGCESWNNDPKNTRVWFPSLCNPGYLNAEHERYCPDGSDPFPDAEIGPKSLVARPSDYGSPRDKTAEVMRSCDNLQSKSKVTTTTTTTTGSGTTTNSSGSGPVPPVIGTPLSSGTTESGTSATHGTANSGMTAGNGTVSPAVVFTSPSVQR